MLRIGLHRLKDGLDILQSDVLMEQIAHAVDEPDSRLRDFYILECLRPKTDFAVPHRSSF